MAFPAPKGLVEYHVKRSMSKYHIGAGAPEHTKGKGGAESWYKGHLLPPLKKGQRGQNINFKSWPNFRVHFWVISGVHGLDLQLGAQNEISPLQFSRKWAK